MDSITDSKENRLKNYFDDDNIFLEHFGNDVRLSMRTDSVLILITKSDLFYEMNILSLKDKYLKTDVKTLIDFMLIKEMCYKGIIELIPGISHIFARAYDNNIYCWGNNFFGQLGNGKRDEDTKQFNKHELNVFLSDLNIEILECGGIHSLALTRNREVYAWGWNSFGQTGNGKDELQLIPIKVLGFGKEKVTRISCGGTHSMALLESGRVYSWGSNEFGQLGFENVKVSHKPKNIEMSDVKISKISCGAYHSLLLTNDGFIYAFGNNDCGQIGNGKIEKQMKPFKLTHEKKFVDIASYWRNNISISLSSDNVYFIWGEFKGEKILKLTETKFDTLDKIFASLNLDRSVNFENDNDLIFKNGYFEKYFTEIDKLGSGSFEEVWKVKHNLSSKIYAVKKMLFEKDLQSKISRELLNLKIAQSFSMEFIINHYYSW
jgi:alpha-tubulin suppressor-like RCC1 family protein